MGIQAAPAVQAVPEGAGGGVMEHLNAGYLQLGLVALVFGGLQVWWIGSTLRRRDLATHRNNTVGNAGKVGSKEQMGIDAKAEPAQCQVYMHSKHNMRHICCKVGIEALTR